MKLLRIALAWLLLSGPVFAQAQLGAGQVWGNSTAAKAPGRSENVTAILDRALGSAQGSVIERGASGWGLIGPGTAGLPFVSAGAGADPLYQVVGVIGGGTGINLYAIGDIVCAIGTTTLSRTADIATGNVLLAGGVGACPTYGKVTSAHITGAALTKTDDTNVTLTLGGTPASALVNAASLTLGWTGQLSIARGGTGQTTQQAAFDALGPTATRAGDIVYWNGTHYVTLAGNNSGTNVLSENASGVPSWAAAGLGTVTQVSQGLGIVLSASPITTTGSVSIRQATIQKFTSGSALTYTSAATSKYAIAKFCGGGGGGAGSGTGVSGGGGGAGNSTVFNGITCTGGGGGTASASGAGGTCSGGSPDEAFPGSPGTSVQTGVSAGSLVSPGGNTVYFAGSTSNTGVTNTGAGGGGGAASGATNTGGGGGGGGCATQIVPGGGATYTYTIGGTSTAGIAGTSGAVGFAGAAGYLQITEH
jgi:hypothetical protein